MKFLLGDVRELLRERLPLRLESELNPLVRSLEGDRAPRPKSLIPSELRRYTQYRSFYRVAEVIGASEGFARQNAGKNHD